MLLILLILFFIFLYFLPITVEFEYERDGNNDNFSLEIYVFFRIFGFKLKVPYLQQYILPFFTRIKVKIENLFINILPVKKEIEEEINLTDRLDEIKKILKIILDKKQISIILSTTHLKCKYLKWKTKIGLGDPAYTAINYGIVYSIKGIILTVIDSKICDIKDPEIKVEPNFYQKKFSTYIKGIFSLALGNIILTGLKILIYRFRGGSKLWPNIRLKN